MVQDLDRDLRPATAAHFYAITYTQRLKADSWLFPMHWHHELRHTDAGRGEHRRNRCYLFRLQNIETN